VSKFATVCTGKPTLKVWPLNTNDRVTVAVGLVVDRQAFEAQAMFLPGTQHHVDLPSFFCSMPRSWTRSTSLPRMSSDSEFTISDGEASHQP